MIALLSLVLSLASTDTYQLDDDGGTFILYGDAQYVLCYGPRCQIGDVVEIADSVANVDATDCIDYSSPDVETCRDVETFDRVYFGHSSTSSRRMVAPPAAVLATISPARHEIAPTWETTCSISCPQ